MTAATGCFPEHARDAPRAALALMLAAAAISLLHLAANAIGGVDELRMGAAHLAMLGALALCVHPVDARMPRLRWLARGALAAALIGGCVAVVVFEDALYARGLAFGTADWVACALVVLLATELTRRTSGVVIPLLVVLGLAYATAWGARVPGAFAFPGLSWETMLFRSVYSGDGMFGGIARISWSYVFLFVLFGAFLVRSGAADLIMALARAAAGRITGGTGLVAVGASGLMGSVTGSAVANTVATGSVTIPLMKRSGFPARFAAGTEAAASTGGQLMPPVMGAGAFLMANFTGIAYLEIIAAALVPALLYFFAVGCHVRIAALRHGAGSEPAGDGEPALAVIRRQWPLLVPLGVLVAVLVLGYTPVMAGIAGIFAVVVCSWLTPRRMGPIAVIEALANGARLMVPTALLLIAVGLVVNVITTTGAGNTLSLMIGDWAGGSLLLTIVLVALASLVLGMGLPVTAAYIVLAAITAPTLQALLGQAEVVSALARGELTESVREALRLVDPGFAVAAGEPVAPGVARALLDAMQPELARSVMAELLDPGVLTATLLIAHMIVFWLSQDSNVTPPVSLAAFAAAGIAGSRPMATGLTAWKLAKALYILPVLFAYTPLLTGTWHALLPLAVVIGAGLWAFAATVEGHLEGPLGAVARSACALAALALLWPHAWWWLDGAALLVFAAIVVTSRRDAGRDQPAAVPPGGGR